MSVDIRSILNVYPDRSSFTCVGTTQKGARCRNNWFSGSDLSYASKILDDMSSYESISISIKDLERLAGLTLCPRWHRKPGYSQVRSLSLEWQNKIAIYEAAVAREKQKASMIQAERILSAVKKNLDNIKVKLEEEETNDKYSIANPRISKEEKTAERFSTYQKAESRMQAMPTKAIAKPALGLVTPPASNQSTPSRVPAPTIAVKTGSNTASGLPSPPASPIKQRIPEQIKQEQSPSPSPARSPQILTITKNSSTKVTATAESPDLPPKTISKEQTKVKAFNFEFPPTPDATPPHQQTKAEAFNFEFPPTPDATPPHKQTNMESNIVKEARNFAYEFGAGKQAPIPAFDVGFTVKLPNSSAVVEDSPTRREDTKRFKAAQGSSEFTFNPDHQLPSKSFEFATPTKLSYAMRLPEKPSTIWDEFNSNADRAAPVSSGSDAFVSKEQPEEVWQMPTTPVKTIPICSSFLPLTPEATPEPTHERNNEEDESYGYIIDTPVSMRYKTYLPSHRHSHGLMPPPDTPEARRDGLQDPFWTSTANTAPPTLAILRKPLPSPPVAQPHQGEAGICEACNIREDNCLCDADSGMENERTGCFHSSRLRRLRKRVVRKLHVVKTKVSNAMRRESSPIVC